MLQLEDADLRRGADLLIGGANVTLHHGWKAGVTGRNGSGKTSLLRLFAGELEPDRGEFRRPADWSIAMMAQEVPALERPALEYVLDGHDELRRLEAQLEQAQSRDDGEAMARSHGALENIRAWALPSRAASILAGLGFPETSQQQPVSSFSGGWRMWLNLARVLMADADLLLLDEPTNHLDLDAVLWLQDWLKRYPGTLILISHDRDFLDATVEHILHIEQGRLWHYRGNYSTFEKRRAEELARQQREYEKQQEQARHLRQFIDRFRAKATKARQAQSRIKALEKLELTAPAHVADGFRFDFPEPGRLPNPMVDLEAVACGHGGTPVLEKVSLNIRPETRLGLLGPNGAGKSTLMRTLAGELPALSGRLTRDPDLVIGYFHQQQVDALPERETPFSLLQATQPRREELWVRNELGRFGFHGDDVFEPVARFSGGEKSRLALALLVQDAPALLLLDEPANHLDLDMREALTLALQAFSGAVVLVSHDRHLLETTVDELVLVAEGGVRVWDGDLDDYARWLRERNSTTTSGETGTARASGSDARQRRQDAARRRESLRPLKQRVAKLEKQLAQCEQQLSALETELADETLYQSERKQELTEKLEQQGQLRGERERLEEELLEAMEELETSARA